MSEIVKLRHCVREREREREREMGKANGVSKGYKKERETKLEGEDG